MAHCIASKRILKNSFGRVSVWYWYELVFQCNFEESAKWNLPSNCKNHWPGSFIWAAQELYKCKVSFHHLLSNYCLCVQWSFGNFKLTGNTPFHTCDQNTNHTTYFNASKYNYNSWSPSYMQFPWQNLLSPRSVPTHWFFRSIFIPLRGWLCLWPTNMLSILAPHTWGNLLTVAAAFQWALNSHNETPKGTTTHALGESI